MMRMSWRPARTASSTTYWMAGWSTSGSISLGCALVAGRNRVPSPAAGITAFFTFAMTAPARGATSLGSGRSSALLGLDAVAPGFLGAIHGHVGCADQLLRGAAVLRVRADADADGQLDAGAGLLGERTAAHDGQDLVGDD